MSGKKTLKLVTRNQLSTEYSTVEPPSYKKSSNKTKHIILFVIFSLITTAFVLQNALFSKAPLSKQDIGRIALQDITATRDFSFEPDQELIKTLKQKAAIKTRPIFSVKKNVWLDLWTTDISYAFRAVQDNIFIGKEELALARFNSLAGINLDKVSFWSLQRIGFKKVKNYLQILYSSVLKNKILVESVNKLKNTYPNGIEIILLPRKQDIIEKPTHKIINSDHFDILIDPEILENLINNEMETRFTLENNASLDMDARRAMLKLAVLLIKNHINPKEQNKINIGIVLNSELTAQKQQKAKKSVRITPKDFVKDDVILKKGKIVTLETIKIVQAMMPNYFVKLFWFMGHFILISIFFSLIAWFSTLKFGGKRATAKDFYVAGFLFLVFLSFIKAGWYLTYKVTPSPDPIFMPALFPITAAALLVRVLMGTRLAVFFAIALSFIATWSTGAPVQYTLFYFITGLVAGGSASRIEHRYVIWRVGLITIGINLLLVTIYRLIDGSLIGINTLYTLVASILGGVMLSIIMSALLPIIEFLGDYVTDIKLLELTNTEHPLLKNLRDKAPGTYQHSQNVADLAYAAAKSVEARALLVKVAAYYHDVGKSKQPKYFIENQAGDNPHDKLKPSMSALIIKNHIKDSKEMLEKANIPKEVILVAIAHHGTTLIEYFYLKAKELAGQEENIREEDYRYPGPIPQSKEAGILMLADTVEAAVRSKSKIIQSKNKPVGPKFDLNTIKETVQTIINKKFSDNQLDSSELTLKDLSIIAESFISTLSSVYHERVSYPDQQDKSQEKDKKNSQQEQNNEHRRSSSSINIIKTKEGRVDPKKSPKNPEKS